MTTAPGSDHDDVLDLLMADHRAVAGLLTELESGDEDPARREQVTDVAVAVLVRHSVAEDVSRPVATPCAAARARP